MATIETRVTKLEEKTTKLYKHLGLVEDTIDPPIPGDLMAPIWEGIAMSSTTGDKFIYSRPQVVNNTWVAFVNTGGSIYQAESLNGLNGWELKPSQAPYGAIIYDSAQWRALYHKWHVWKQGYCSTYMKVSNDKINWYDSSVDKFQFTGEDRTWFNDNGLYRCYIRPLPPTPPANAKRTIGYMETTNYLKDWSPIREVLAPDAQDGADQFYMMSVVKTSVGYFGMVTVYNTDNAGTCYVQLVYSANGIDNWKRCNNRAPFIPMPGSHKQMYANGNIIGDNLYIYTIECERGHDEYVIGKHHYSSRYMLPVNELIKYKPV